MAADDHLDLLEALKPVKSELRCAACGYGIVSADAPGECPMCHGTEWEPVAWRPFSRLSELPTRESRPAGTPDY